MKLWKRDFSETLLEVKLESQANVLKALDERYVVCGCLNGTLGILDREKKQFSYLVRSH